MSKSKIFFYFCVSLISGIAIRQIADVYQPVIPAVFVLGIFLISIFYENKKAVFIGFLIIFFGIGIWRSDLSVLKAENNDFVKYKLLNRDVIFSAEIVSEPQNNDKFKKITIGNIKINEAGKEIKINGKAIITTNRYPELGFNDKIEVSGRLETPVISDKFDYQKYLKKDNIFAVMGFPKLTLIGHKRSGIKMIYEKVLFFKGKLREGIEKNFSIAQSSVLEGMILGDNNALSNDLKNKLNITGLRHVIAISGTHVVILSAILMSFFIAIGLWRGQAFYLSLFFIIIYIILSGSPSSGIRSGIMGGVFMYGQKIGRKSISVRTIVIAGGIMLFINPLLLFYDVGFELSFLACLGMIYLSPIISKFFNRVLSDKFIALQNIISATLAAQIFTLPIMIYNFGNISLISVVTNILVLPIIYPLMVFGFVASFMCAPFDLISWIFVLPAWLIVSYFIKIIDIFSLPQFLLQIDNVPLIYIFAFYIALGLFIFYFNKKSPKGFLIRR